ncbi:MAG: hypothetical protein A3F84_07175 [Candidatus Handelsmanbacteria bacterium RIFCSPLOWO2_12_FULL_64_10]|uniref:DUF86 domain-containing protein n=1 Tax=Handelsmanbacteria sp. (strain RIFCSPLOWO2_12_FULL_64_10) TaxID=1817868 RepID=A0A1F6CBF9_HANXR|nr:MAG: hypothetical protein A3F84_07175 [Candidatus Handelsmanbacteria bacterium RIFCSPLOWO2_12_FULL_64_10]
MDAEWRARIARADASLQRLEEIRASCRTLAEYVRDRDTAPLTERHVQIVVEAVLDLANLLIERNAWGAPDSGRKAVELLVQRKAISPRLGKSVITWIHTRNLIVHEYARIDDARLHRALRLHLKALRSAVAILSKRAGIA